MPASSSTPEAFCDTCLMDFPKTSTLSFPCCSCLYCTSCLETYFRMALKESKPARCCDNRMDILRAAPFLPNSLVREYKNKWEEMITKDRTYCYKNNCSAFIARRSIHNHVAHCQKCNGKTCAKCKAKEHFGVCIPGMDEALAALVELRGWRKCPECPIVIERSQGCSHME